MPHREGRLCINVCYFSRSPEILVDLWIFFGKFTKVQTEVAFVLWGWRRRVDDFSLFDCLSPFRFLLN